MGVGGIMLKYLKALLRLFQRRQCINLKPFLLSCQYLYYKNCGSPLSFTRTFTWDAKPWQRRCFESDRADGAGHILLHFTLSPGWCVLRLAAGTGYWPPLTLAPGPRGLGTGAPLPARRHLTGPRTHPLPCCLHLQLASTKLITNAPIEIIRGNKCAIIIVKVRFLFKRSGLIISTECPLSTVHGV